MGTHASVLVVNTDRTEAAYGYEHGDGQEMAELLLAFATTRNGRNAWECRDDVVDDMWEPTPRGFITAWAAWRTAEHVRYGRTGAGVEYRTEGVDPTLVLGTEYSHLVVVDGIQVVSLRRCYNATWGSGGSYTVTFDRAPYTRPETHPCYAGTPPTLHP